MTKSASDPTIIDVTLTVDASGVACVAALLSAVDAYAALPDGDEGKQAKLDARHAIDVALQHVISVSIASQAKATDARCRARCPAPSIANQRTDAGSAGDCAPIHGDCLKDVKGPYHHPRRRGTERPNTSQYLGFSDFRFP
jgi:hypothetical protein